MPGLVKLISFLEIMSPPADIFLFSCLKLISSSPFLGFISFVFLLKFPGGCEPPGEPYQTGFLFSLNERWRLFLRGFLEFSAWKAITSNLQSSLNS